MLAQKFCQETWGVQASLRIRPPGEPAHFAKNRPANHSTRCACQALPLCCKTQDTTRGQCHHARYLACHVLQDMAQRTKPLASMSIGEMILFMNDQYNEALESGTVPETPRWLEHTQKTWAAKSQAPASSASDSLSESPSPPAAASRPRRLRRKPPRTQAAQCC